ncbi:fumarylacetoacetate hydrolase family protein [Amphiplicatus metriothermophilus]|uniref:2,4-diketo-3-deoxy-L-fuconate hydrolase n=1 Tax=Amphiplicatus metriothermophilus TaxID=1519374 RepID=A0A239PVL1_9PROT|nr:fumarylacetoacetate hydrolase family protein [Amphiplicatus metriothermophilus]MBB5519647.1 2-keto-4-pentenoate hydratase/2-oxohepta-3-ene-1,7-dioic acid hydratase in catechol pathway [Amphiplicatus metriothermophilus]SNT74210.1 2,4-diketo-3-deoxy-L-fuconate hydrolase [Amphiplicatus metriothermophilus]
MKLVRFGPKGREKPGMLDAAGVVRDLSGVVDDIAGETLTPAGLAALRALDPAALPAAPAGERLGPCVGRVGKFVCVGLNYADHAAETGAEPPAEPVLFMKATSAISGPCDDVVRPRGSTKLDWEIELGVVIGKEARHVSEEEARGHIAGYCVVNDISERAFQLESTGQWTKGKSCDTFGPIGPHLATAEEIPDPLALSMRLSVNGRTCQNGSTRTMIFGPYSLVSYISRFMSLQPGDVISTGTPPGVGLGRNPPTFLKPGDVMELEIEGLGVQRQRVVDYDG